MENCCCFDCNDFDLYADYGTWGMLWNAGPKGRAGHKDLFVRRVPVPRFPHGILRSVACCMGLCSCCSVDSEQDGLGCSKSDTPGSLCVKCKRSIRWAILWRNIFVWGTLICSLVILSVGCVLLGSCQDADCSRYSRSDCLECCPDNPCYLINANCTVYARPQAESQRPQAPPPTPPLPSPKAQGHTSHSFSAPTPAPTTALPPGASSYMADVPAMGPAMAPLRRKEAPAPSPRSLAPGPMPGSLYTAHCKPREGDSQLQECSAASSVQKYYESAKRCNSGVAMTVSGTAGLIAWVALVVGTSMRPCCGSNPIPRKSVQKKQTQQGKRGPQNRGAREQEDENEEMSETKEAAPHLTTSQVTPDRVEGFLPPGSSQRISRQESTTSSGSGGSSVWKSRHSIFTPVDSWKESDTRRLGKDSTPQGSKERIDAALKFVFRKFSYKELLELTDKFSNSNVLGKGAFGKVYQGYSPATGWVAVKVSTDTEQSAGASFEEEVSQMAHLNHGNITRLLGFCNDDLGKGSKHIFVYELARGGSLKNRLINPSGSKTPFTLLKRLRVAVHIARGLGYLHEQGFVHRDIKPDNILLTEDDTAKVGDFGTLKLVPKGEEEATISEPVFTKSAYAGTPGYIPPESIQGELSFGADVYAFGVIMFQLVTGRRGHITDPKDFAMIGATVGHTLYTSAWALDIVQTLDPSSLVPTLFLDPVLLQAHDGKPIVSQGKVVPEANAILLEFLRLAADCVDRKHSKRPTLNGVKVYIERIKALYKRWLQKGNTEGSTSKASRDEATTTFEKQLKESA